MKLPQLPRSTRSTDDADDSHLPNLKKHLYPRKGGGGGRGGSGGGRTSSGSKGGSKGGGSSSKKPSARKGAPLSFSNSKFSNGFSLGPSAGKAQAAPYSDGGGKPFTLNTGSFSGRQFGGGSRPAVYGSRTFGSGYPYGSSGYYVNYRPFPFGFYPVPLHTNYYGSTVYIDASDRPGGNLVSALVQPSYNTSAVTYRLVGDNSSVSSVFYALASNCSVANSTSPLFNFKPLPNGDSSQWPVPEQVVQWYRASTFALTLDGYNNTAALDSNQPETNTTSNYTRLDDTPLPSGLNMTFLACLNATIGSAVPLIDTSSNKMSAGDIVKVVFLSIFGFAILVGITIVLWGFVAGHCCKRREGKQGKKISITEDNDRVINLDDPSRSIVNVSSDSSESLDPKYTNNKPQFEMQKPFKDQSWWRRVTRTPFARQLGYKPIKVDENDESPHSDVKNDKAGGESPKS